MGKRQTANVAKEPAKKNQKNRQRTFSSKSKGGKGSRKGGRTRTVGEEQRRGGGAYPVNLDLGKNRTERNEVMKGGGAKGMRGSFGSRNLEIRGRGS